MATYRTRRTPLLVLATAALLALGSGDAGEIQTLYRTLNPAPAAAPTPTPPKSAETPGNTVMLPGFDAGPAEPRPGAAILRIGLERTRCLVACPAFTFIVERDGSFSYDGEFGVERLGRHSGRIDPGRVLQVMDVVADLGIADLDASYASTFLDNASSYLLVEGVGGAHVIENQAGAAPPRVWAVEQLIEALLEHAQWDDAAEPEREVQ